MTREEFTGATLSDLNPSRTQISRSLEFSVVNVTEIALNIGACCTKSIFYELADYRQDNSLC